MNPRSVFFFTLKTILKYKKSENSHQASGTRDECEKRNGIKLGNEDCCCPCRSAAAAAAAATMHETSKKWEKFLCADYNPLTDVGRRCYCSVDCGVGELFLFSLCCGTMRREWHLLHKLLSNCCFDRNYRNSEKKKQNFFILAITKKSVSGSREKFEL